MPTTNGNYVLITQVTGNLSNVNWASVQTPLLIQPGPAGLILTAAPNGVTLSTGKPPGFTQFPTADPDGGYTLPSNGPVIGSIFSVFVGTNFIQPNLYQVFNNRVLPSPGPWSGQVTIFWSPQ